MKNLISLYCLLNCFLAFSQNQVTHESYFETDKYELTENELLILSNFIKSIDSLDISKITLFGFCDDRGGENYNLILSQNRAEHLKNILLNNEIEEALITTIIGKGELDLIAIDRFSKEEIRQKNRKVLITVDYVFPPQQIVLKNQVKSFKEIIDSKLKKGDNILLENILFKMGYSDIVPESRKVLDDIVSVLLERTDIYFTIQGHVCCTQYARDAIDRATRIRNLSEARAKFIYDYFAKKGIDKRRMKYVGLRRKFPLGGDPKFDRRVEILITYVAKDN